MIVRKCWKELEPVEKRWEWLGRALLGTVGKCSGLLEHVVEVLWGLLGKRMKFGEFFETVGQCCDLCCYCCLELVGSGDV